MKSFLFIILLLAGGYFYLEYASSSHERLAMKYLKTHNKGVKLAKSIRTDADAISGLPEYQYLHSEMAEIVEDLEALDKLEGDEALEARKSLSEALKNEGGGKKEAFTRLLGQNFLSVGARWSGLSPRTAAPLEKSSQAFLRESLEGMSALKKAYGF